MPELEWLNGPPAFPKDLVMVFFQAATDALWAMMEDNDSLDLALFRVMLLTEGSRNGSSPFNREIREASATAAKMAEGIIEQKQNLKLAKSAQEELKSLKLEVAMLKNLSNETKELEKNNMSLVDRLNIETESNKSLTDACSDLHRSNILLSQQLHSITEENHLLREELNEHTFMMRPLAEEDSGVEKSEIEDAETKGAEDEWVTIQSA